MQNFHNILENLLEICWRHQVTLGRTITSCFYSRYQVTLRHTIASRFHSRHQVTLRPTVTSRFDSRYQVTLGCTITSCFYSRYQVTLRPTVTSRFHSRYQPSHSPPNKYLSPPLEIKITRGQSYATCSTRRQPGAVKGSSTQEYHKVAPSDSRKWKRQSVERLIISDGLLLLYEGFELNIKRAVELQITHEMWLGVVETYYTSEYLIVHHSMYIMNKNKYNFLEG